MTTGEAVSRLKWRFGNKKPFVASVKDVEALNCLIEFVNAAKEEKIAYNQGFAKLYITTFVWQLEKYQATPMDNFVQIEIHKMLNLPLEYFYKRATERINDIEANNFLREIAEKSGVEVKHPALTTDEDKAKERAALNELLKIDGNMERFLSTAWKEDEVRNNLDAMVSEALVRFKF